MQLRVWAIDDDPVNQVVYDLLTETLGVKVFWLLCPPGLRDFYRMPFVEDATGRRHFGVDDIRTWVERECKNLTHKTK